MHRQCTVISGRIDAKVAVDIISPISKGDIVYIESLLYYPYFQFEGHCKIPMLFGSKVTDVVCLVDAVTGHGATADRFKTSQISIADADLIEPGVSSACAKQMACRTVTHSLSRNLRVISEFDLALKGCGVVYKGFWIVSDGSVRSMVDQVNGSLHPLRSRAA